jgi:hypothetical protein
VSDEGAREDVRPGVDGGSLRGSVAGHRPAGAPLQCRELAGIAADSDAGRWPRRDAMQATRTVDTSHQARRRAQHRYAPAGAGGVTDELRNHPVDAVARGSSAGALTGADESYRSYRVVGVQNRDGNLGCR